MPDGNIITVIFEMNAGNVPDVIHVIPPMGYYAMPPSIVVPENMEGTVQIFEGGLG
jgi:hypothetical protein